MNLEKEQMKRINLSDIIKKIWKRKILIIIIVVIVAILSSIISLFLPQKFVATSTILIPDSESSTLMGLNANLSAFGLGDVLSGDQDKMKLLAILHSNQLYNALDKKFDLQQKYGTLYREYTFDRIRKNLRIQEGDQEQIIISMIDKDQKIVAEMVNFVVYCLDSLNISLTTKKATNNRLFIETRVDIVKDSLRFVQTLLSDYMKKNDIISIPDQVKYGIENASAMKAKISIKKIELALRLQNYSEDSPNLIMLKDEIELLQQEYDKYFYKDNNLFISFHDVPQLQMTYLELENRILYLSKLLEYVGTQFEKSKIDEAKDIPTIQILDKAVKPNIRYSPKRVRIVIMSCFMAFLIIAFLILIIENHNSRNG